MFFPSELASSARWIWPGRLFNDLHNTYALFRKSFRLENVPETAPVLITADQSYQLYVNGHFICRGPARGYQRCWPYDEADIAPWLRNGENVIAVRAHNPGFSTFQYRFEGFAGLLFMARWGGEVVSNSTWRARLQSGIVRDTVTSSLQLFCQEHVDARAEADDWMSPEFDDSDWETPATSSMWNSPPWFSLEPRGIPLLAERWTCAQKILGRLAGTNAPAASAPRNIVEPVRREDLWHAPVSCDENPPGKLHFPATGTEGFASVLLDFGHTVVGNLRLVVSETNGDEIVDAIFAETIAIENGHIAPRLDHPEVSLGCRLICRRGGAAHTFYHPYGFRYLMLRVRHATVPLVVEASLREISYPLEQQGRFTSSDVALNRIWNACVRTQRVCSLDAYVDTPWREQAQWWGDARVQAWNTFHLTNDARLLRRGIRCISRQTTPDGLTYGHAPTMAHNCVLPDFTLIWILTLWDDYWQTGSLELFLDEEIQGVLARALDYFREHTDAESGLVAYDPRYWLFLDWTSLDKEGRPALLSLWLLLALDKAAELYRLANRLAQAAPLVEWAGRVRASLRHLANAEGLFGDGFSADGSLIRQTSVHTQTLALMTGLAERPAALLERVLLPFIRDVEMPAAVPSVYWRTYIFSMLDEHGYGEDVVRHISKHWEVMAEHGTTWSQLKEYGGRQSHSHAWSAHPLYHFMQIIGGIRQRAAGWHEIEFHPLFWGDHAETTVPAPQGLLQSSWRRNGGLVCVKLALPDGVAARVRLPGIDCVRTGGEHRWDVLCT
ncbi:alpha-L-rhamnosidase [Opitutaceae bacterium TAV1]|nr:alpha-L-rhamnosidase [Opitutaceae bacterium TAV1]